MQHALYLSLPVLVLPAPQLINRAFLPAYARAVADLLKMGGESAFTEISIRIPVSDPMELVQQGTGHGANGSSDHKQHHRRMSSLSSRPTSMHQQQLSLTQLNQISNGTGPAGPGGIPGSRIVSAASTAVGQRSVTHSAIQGDPSSTWEMWDCIRSLCGYHPRLTVSEYVLLCGY